MGSHPLSRVLTLVLAAPLVVAAAAGAQGTITIGDLPPGEAVTVTFDATIRNDGPPFPIPFGTTFVVNQGTVSGTNFADLLTDDPDDPMSDADPTETPLDVLTLGDVVWNDLDGNGVFDGGILDAGIDGVQVNLFTDDGGTPGLLDAGDTFRGSTTTAGGGLWAFGSLTPGEYVVQVDSSNFGAGGALENFFSVMGVTDPDNDVDDDDNGVDTPDFAGGISSMAITLITDTEPDTPADGDGVDGNLTLDFGFEEIVADLQITKTDGLTEATPGGQLTYTIEASNPVGPSDIEDATVADGFPAELSCTWTCAAAGGGDCTGGPVAGDINDTVDLPVGATVTYTAVCDIDPDATGTLSNTATVTGPPLSDDPDPGNNSATDDTDLVPEADLAITKTDGLTEATPGEQLTYTIEASNAAGPSDIVGATVADSFPAELSCTWTCVAGGGASCTAGPVAGDINDTVDLPVGGSATYTAVCDIDPAATGTLSNTATVAVPAGSDDPVPGNDSATDDDTELVPEADLAITKTDGLTEATPGEQLTYTIEASNAAGPSDIVGATVADAFPAELSCTWTCAGAGGATCSGGPVPGDIDDTVDLPVGGSATYTAVCDIDPAATGTLSNTATVTVPAGSDDPVPGNDSATDGDTLLVPEADLVVTKTDAPDPVTAGDGLTYTVTVENLGPSDALDVVATDTLPGEVVFVSTAGCAEDPNGVPTCTLGTIAAGATAQYTISVTVPSSVADGATLTNEVAVSASTDLINTGDDATSEETIVQRQVDIRIEKVGVPDPEVVAGAGGGTQNLTHTVTVTNDGPSDATGIVVSDVITLPAGVTVDSITPSQGTFVDPTWTLGDLVAGAAATLTIVYDVSSAAEDGATVDDTATLGSVNESESGPGPNSATVSTGIVREASLTLAKSESIDPVIAGSGPGNLVYEVTVTNDGPSDVTALEIEEVFTLPTGVTVDSVVVSAGSFVDTVPPDGVWTLDLPAGDSETLTATLTVDATAESGTDVIADTATVLGSGGGEDLSGDSSVTEATSILAEADLEVTIAALVDPIAGGGIQLYELTVTNGGPAAAVDTMLQHELPLGGRFLGAEPATFACTLSSGVLVTCDLGTLDDDETVVVTVGVLIDHRFDGSHGSEAVVSATNPDPDGSNDEAETDTDVARARTILALTEAGELELAMVAKEGDNTVALVLAELDGGGRQYSVEAVGYRTVALTEVASFGGSSASEIAALAAGFDGSTRVVVVDADSQELLGDYAIAGNWQPIDVQSLPSFGGTTAEEIAVLLRAANGSEVRVLVFDAASGAPLGNHTVAAALGAPAPFPIGLDRIAHFAAEPVPELVIALKDLGTGEVSLLVVDPDAGLLAGHSLGTDLFPLGVAGLEDLGLGGGTAAPDAAVLLRRASDGDLFASVVDAGNGMVFPPVDFADALLPGAFARVPDAGGSAGSELAVAGRVDPSDLTVELRDAATGAGLNTIVIPAAPAVPLPLGLAAVAHSAGGPSPELAILLELFGQPAQVQVFDALGAAPLFVFFLP